MIVSKHAAILNEKVKFENKTLGKIVMQFKADEDNEDFDKKNRPLKMILVNMQFYDAKDNDLMCELAKVKEDIKVYDCEFTLQKG